MIIIKIIAIIITTASGLLQIGLEYRWRDKRTKFHKSIRSLLIVLMVIGSITAVTLLIYDDKDSKEQIKSLTFLKNSAEKSAKDAESQINSLTILRLNAERTALEAEKRELKAQEDRSKIQGELDKINEQMKPLLDIAVAKYPNVSADKALRQLAERINSIEAETVNTKKELENTKQELILKTSDRKLTKEQEQFLIQSLSGISGKVIVNADLADSEANMYANQIKAALSETNLEVVNQPSTGIVSLYRKGIVVLVMDIKNTPPHAVAVLKAIQKIEPKAIGTSVKDAKFPQDAVMIWVCHK